MGSWQKLTSGKVVAWGALGEGEGRIPSEAVVGWWTPHLGVRFVRVRSVDSKAV